MAEAALSTLRSHPEEVRITRDIHGNVHIQHLSLLRRGMRGGGYQLWVNQGLGGGWVDRLVDRGHLRGRVGEVAHGGLAGEEAWLGASGLACSEALAATADMKGL